MAINWNKQWRLHAPNYHNGYVIVHLNNSVSFKMKPGPGFGDASHPTTKIMLSMLPKSMSSTVVDLGCGSGILAIAAKTLGAKKVFALDIDPQALNHTRENSLLNSLDIVITHKLTTFLEKPLILMNMISSEQTLAWDNLPRFKNYTLICSGFLKNEKEPHSYGTLIKKKVLGDWIGYMYEK